jgi:hypothetical protein
MIGGLFEGQTRGASFSLPPRWNTVGMLTSGLSFRPEGVVGNASGLS